MLGACIVCTACASRKAPSAAPSPVPVATAIAERGVLRPTLELAGVVAPYRQVGVAADLNEPFTEVDVQEGDHVRAGQVLARQLVDDLEAQLASSQRIVSEDVARYNQTAYEIGAVNAQDVAAVNSARAVLRQAQVNLAGAQTDLQRYLQLGAAGFIAPQTIDEQRVTVATDEQAVASDRAALNQAIANLRSNGSGANNGQLQQELAQAREAANSAEATVVQLRREIARATVLSPVEGIVDSANANPGEYPSGRQIFTIEQVGRVYAILPASSTQILTVRQGASAVVQAAGTTTRFDGKVAAILDQLEPGTTNFTVKALLANPGDVLRAGMPVSAQVSEPPVSGVVIPVTAFVDDTHTSVYVVRAGTVRAQTVTSVKEDGTDAVVTGLAAGTPIVKDVEAANVGNGDRVAVGP